MKFTITRKENELGRPSRMKKGWCSYDGTTGFLRLSLKEQGYNRGKDYRKSAEEIYYIIREAIEKSEDFKITDERQ